MRILIIILLTFLFLGCKTQRRIPTVIEREVKTVVRDTVFQVERDSSRAVAIVDCLEGKPVIKMAKETEGTYLKVPRLVLNDSILTVDCEARAQELFAQWKETHSTEKTEVPVYINELTFWQEVQINLGRAFLLLAVLITAVQLFKKRL